MSLPTCPREDCTFAGPHHDHYRSTGIARDRAEVPDCRCCAPRTPEDERIVAWHMISGHPLFRKCYDTEGPLLRSMLARLDGLADMTSLPTPQSTAVVLPTVDEVADVLRSGDGPRFSSDTARDILDLIAARMPVWQPIAPGTVIKAGTRVRRPYLTDSGAVEHILPTDTPANDGWCIDPRGVPAEPVDPRAELLAEELHNHGGCEEVWPCCSVSTVEHYRNDARDLLARLDAVRADA